MTLLCDGAGQYKVEWRRYPVVTTSSGGGVCSFISLRLPNNVPRDPSHRKEDDPQVV